jgi:large conductance mechanosensitive channel
MERRTIRLSRRVLPDQILLPGHRGDSVSCAGLTRRTGLPDAHTGHPGAALRRARSLLAPGMSTLLNARGRYQMPRMPIDLDAPSGMVRGAGKELGGFKKFILRGNVVDLAVGVVIGAAFTGVVQALVKDVITPIIGIFGGNPDFSSWVLTVGSARLQIGDFLNALISFLLIALVVYLFVVLPVNKLMDRYRPAPQPAPTKNCPECTTKIPQMARRCPQCTAQLEAPSEEVAAAMRQAAAPSGADVADEAARVLADRLQGKNSPR